MCLSTVYALQDNKREMLCKNVASVRTEGDKLIFTDIMGVKTEIDAAIERIDLMESFIVIRRNG